MPNEVLQWEEIWYRSETWIHTIEWNEMKWYIDKEVNSPRIYDNTRLFFVPKNKALYMRHTGLKGDTDICTSIVGNFYTLLSVIDRTSREIYRQT